MLEKIDNAPTVDAVSKDLFEQYKWERDTALETLEEHGLSLGQKKEQQMKYAFQINKKTAEVNCSDELTIEEMEIVKDMVIKLCDARIIDLKKQSQNKLPLTADIDSLYPELSVRTKNVLKRGGCKTIQDVLNCTPTDLKNMRNMGKHSLEEIEERFSAYGHFRETAKE